MSNKFLNRSMNHVWWLILAMDLSLALLLLVPTAQAAIAIQDGSPLALPTEGTTTISQSFHVTAGASVLVVILEDRQNAVVLAEPALTFNGVALVQDTNSLANTSNYRSMAMYHLYNPPAVTANITGSYSAGNNTVVLTAYTLSGVNTATNPLVLQANNSGSVTSFSGSTNGVTAGSWAAVGSIWGATGETVTTTGTGGTATMTNNNNIGGSTMSAGYVANLSAGSVTVGASVGTATKGCFIADIFAPAPATSAPTITTQPSWSPATNYAVLNPSAQASVVASGTAPLSYQWYTNATTSALSDNANHIGSTSNILTITSAAVADSTSYTVVITNLYGSVTSSAAILTVLPLQSATNFTLNYGGSPQNEGAGSDWNTTSKWNPSGLSAANATTAFPGSSFEVVVGSLVRNPAGSLNNVFPGNASLEFDGNGIPDFTTPPASMGEIRFKNSGNLTIPSTNYFSNLILNGGELNIGDSMDVNLQGQITVLTNSVFGTQGGNGTNQTYWVNSYLTGSGTIVLYLSNTNTYITPPLPPATLNIMGTTNTFTGQWNVLQGPLLGSGTNSLGTNTITIGTNGILETSYPVNDTNGNLILNGQMFLTQTDAFNYVFVNGTALTPGTYSAATLSASYPSNFPATFIALDGSTATSASGQITVLASPTTIISLQPVSLSVFQGLNAQFSVTAAGVNPLYYYWQRGGTNIQNGGEISGSGSNVLTFTGVTLADATNYSLVISNSIGSVTSSVVSLTVIATNAYQSAALLAGPLAYYAFNETNANPNTGGVVAYDSMGVFNGTYGVACSNGFNGIAGPRTTPDGLTGFPNSNTALATVSNTANSYVTLPAFNLNNGVGTNLLTITAWVNPKTVQANNVGIVFCRAGTTVSGLDYNSVNGHLGYTWNNESGTYGWDSGITPPANVWSLVALVVTSTNATVYIINTNGLLASTHVYTHVGQKFDGSTLIGQDSFNVNRTFNGSIDEVALFNQALSTNQVLSLFAGASGVFGFPPVIINQPAWSPATNYAALYPVTVATVVASGMAPFSYQWYTTNGTTVSLTDNANHIIGSTSNVLTISNAVASDSQNYIVVITNLYGSVTSSAAMLTVLPTQPATNFTLNFGGSPVFQGSGDWNSVNIWNPSGLSAANAMAVYPGSSFEVVPGSLLRTPANAGTSIFPGVQLTVDGNGVFTNNGSSTVSTMGQIKFKLNSPPTTNYFSLLTMAGGQWDNGGLNVAQTATPVTIVIQGTVNIVSNTPIYVDSGGNTNRPFQIDAFLEGNGGIEYHDYTNVDGLFGGLLITGNTNTYSGKWNVVQGPLIGSGTNSLGTNTISIGANGILETAYDINNTNSSLILNGKFYLHQNDTFQSVVVGGVALSPGIYTFTQLNSSYPTKFPTSWTQLLGSTVTAGSGSITVLSGPVIALTSSAQTNGYLGAVTFTAAVKTNGVTAGNATGSVIFFTTSGPISTNTVSAGFASSASVSSLPRGTNIITANYSGDSSYFGSTTTLSQIVTNHPPVANVMTVTRTAGLALIIALSNVASNWSDSDNDTVELTGVTMQSTNGINLLPLNWSTNLDGSIVTTNAYAYIGYTNSPNVADQISYSISDGQGGTNIGYVNIVVVNSVTGTNSITAFTYGTSSNSVTAYGIPSYHYILERATNLASPAWVDVQTNQAATNGVINAADTFWDLGGVPPSPSAFYQLKWQP